MSIAGKVIGLLGGVFNLFAKGGAQGGVVVRKPGGTPGTQEVQIYHDGTDAFVDPKTGVLRTTPGVYSVPLAQSGQPGNPAELRATPAASGSGAKGGDVLLTPGAGDGAGLPGFLKAVGATAAGNPLAKFLPSSGASFVRINDNGTVVIDSDFSSGNYPLTIKYNGSSLWQFAFSGALNDASGAGTGVINIGGGNITLVKTGSTFYCDAAGHTAVTIIGAVSQTADLQQWQNSSGTPLAAVNKNGGFKPSHLADAAAANDTVYYSTDAAKLVYKDSGGVVNNLY